MYAALRDSPFPGGSLRRGATAFAALATLAAGPALVSQSADSAAKTLPALQIKETLIAEAPEGTEFGATYVVQDHAAWVADTHGTRTVWLDGKRVGDAYDDAKYLELTPDGQHLAWIAKRDGKWFAVVDGIEHTRHYGKLTALALGENASPVLAGACNGKSCHLVTDTVESGLEYQEISYPALSSDRQHTLFVGKRDGKWVMVLDGTERGPKVDDIWEFSFSPSEHHAVMAAQVKNKMIWVIDSIAGPAFEVISPIKFAADDSMSVYGGVNSETTGLFGAGHHKTHGQMVRNGLAGQIREGEGFGGGFSEAFIARTSLPTGVQYLTATFAGVGTPTITQDGGLFYTARVGPGDVAVFRDTTALAHYQDVVSPIVAASYGKHLLFIARADSEFVEIVDMKAGAKIPVQNRAVVFVGRVVMNKDGVHHAYVIIRGGSGFKQGTSRRAMRTVVLDGIPGPEFDAYGIEAMWFSDDGRHFSYVVSGASGDRDLLVFDGNRTNLYDTIYPASVNVLDDRNIEFTARGGGRWVRVQATVP